MNNATYKKLKEINNLLWRVCNDEYIRREELKRKREKKKSQEIGGTKNE